MYMSSATHDPYLVRGQGRHLTFLDPVTVHILPLLYTLFYVIKKVHRHRKQGGAREWSSP